MTEPLIRNVSDTALWVAMYRAEENDRPDALFRDPYARGLAGERGARILASMSGRGRGSWPFIARTWTADRFIERLVGEGVDAVLNLAAGLDTRPYCMALPPALRWIEADLPGMVGYKEEALAGEKPACRLERVACDLADETARRALLARVSGEARNALVLSEGLVCYLPREKVVSLAEDLAAAPNLRHWITDLMSPGLLELLRREFSGKLDSAPLVFGPAEGPAFFEPRGWKPVEVRSHLKTAAKLGRLPWPLRLMAWLPESDGAQGRRPWAAVCRLEKV